MSEQVRCSRPAVIARRRWWSEPRRLIAYITCAAMLAASGCTTMHTVESRAEAGTSNVIEPGEMVVVSLRDGRQLELAFVDWSSLGFTGTDELGILQKIAPEDIARVEVERYSAMRSVGLGVVVAGFLLGIAVAASGDSIDY